MMLENSAEVETKQPAHLHVYQELRNLILFGNVAPGEALTIQGLQKQTGAGMTPVREALRRLCSEGAIEMLGNRRQCIPILQRSDVEELFFMRKMLEPELAARATPFVSDAIIAQMHQIDTCLNATIKKGDVQGYMQQNYLFHKTLYDCADAPVISDTVDRLWLRFGPSQREMFGRVGTSNLPDRHVEVLKALEVRDPKAAAHAMAEDVVQGQFLHLGKTSAVDAT